MKQRIVAVREAWNPPTMAMLRFDGMSKCACSSNYVILGGAKGWGLSKRAKYAAKKNST